MKHVFIVNPAAGKGKTAEKLCDMIPEAARRCDIKSEIYVTKCVGDAEKAVRSFCLATDEKLRFYCCGGDGTLSEVLCGAADFSDAEIAVIPCGTGNDFVRNFDKRELFFDIEAQIKGRSMKVDGMKVGGRYALNMVNMGFDCSVVERVAKIKMHPFVPGGLAYIFGVVIELLRLPGVKVKEFFLDGKRVDAESLLLCTLAGGAFYGGGFNSSPLAKINDGIIDVCVVKPISRFNFVRLIGRYKNGTHLDNPRLRKYLSYHKCRTAYIDFGYERNICIDGEIVKASCLDIEIIPEKFNFVLPEGVTYDGFSAEREKEKITV